jgi:hypothetical protein
MKTERKPLHGVPQRRNQENLSEQAIELDRQIKAALKVAERSLTDLGRLLARMRESRLWEHLPGHYRGWEEYARSVMGHKSHSSLYEIVAADSLTEGANGVPPEVVNRMGVKRAAQFARLKPEQRTAEIISAATTQTVAAFKQVVQKKLNEDLPPDERKPMLVLFAINLPAEMVDEYEETLEVMMYVDDVRDGDNTQSMRMKAMGVILFGARQYFAPELAEALKLKKVAEGVHDSPANAFQEDGPEEDDGYDFSEQKEAF